MCVVWVQTSLISTEYTLSMSKLKGRNAQVSSEVFEKAQGVRDCTTLFCLSSRKDGILRIKTFRITIFAIENDGLSQASSVSSKNIADKDSSVGISGAKFVQLIVKHPLSGALRCAGILGCFPKYIAVQILNYTEHEELSSCIFTSKVATLMVL